jgi:hypothetical protein
MKQIRNVALCLAILGVGLPAAADVKAINGAVCQPAGSYDLTYLHYDAVRGVVADATVQVACPLIRDRINSTTSLNSVVVEFFSYNASGDDIECSLYAHTEDYGGSYVDFDSDSTNAFNGTQLTFNVSSTNGNEGTYGLHCELGIWDEINHIHINEDSGAAD